MARKIALLGIGLLVWGCSTPAPMSPMGSKVPYQIQALTPNDPSFSTQWGMAKIQAPDAWDINTGNGSVIVGVIDTGIDYNHPDLAGNMWLNPNEIPNNGIDEDNDISWSGYELPDDMIGINILGDSDLYAPMDDSSNSHGTHVAGIIGAVGNNSTGVSGINWDVQLLPVKTSVDGTAGSGEIETGVLYTIYKGAKVLNISWGHTQNESGLLSAIQQANTMGVLVICASGNNGQNNDTTTYPIYPASSSTENIISVSATDSSDNLASFSNYGATTVDLGAPGYNIYSTKRNNTYGNLSGTSMAAPMVTGVVALIWSEYPTLTHLQVKQAILEGVDYLPALDGKVVSNGRLNAYKALLRAGEIANPVNPFQLTGKVQF